LAICGCRKRKQKTKNNFKLRKNFNNSDLGALDFIIDKSSIAAGGLGVQSSTSRRWCVGTYYSVIDIE